MKAKLLIIGIMLFVASSLLAQDAKEIGNYLGAKI
jgi:hypothetical protein